jgi:hypothetical protein
VEKQMTLAAKILISLGALAIAGMIAIILYNQHQLAAQQTAIQTQLVATKQLADNINRAMGTWATKADLDAFAKDNDLNLQVIKDDLATLNASVTAISQVSVASNPQVANNIGSTSTTTATPAPNPNPPPTVTCNGNQIPCPTQDPFGFLSNRQVLHIDEQFPDTKVPVGDVGFSAWQQKPWDINIQPRQYNATTVLGTDENNKQYAYNKFTIKVGDKEYPVKISNNTFMQEYPTATFSWWNPRLYLGADGSINLSSLHGEATPGLHVSFMSYGQYKTQPDLAILQVGAGYGIDSHHPQLVITPASYNIGKFIPLMNNLYVGPSAQVDTTGNVGVGVGFRVGM